MKLVAIGDIHGCYKTMLALIDKVNGQYPDEKLQYIFLGDYVDRGPYSNHVIQYMIDHPEHITLRGNHEDMMVDSLENHYNDKIVAVWLQNGGSQTLVSYEGKIPKSHFTFLSGLQTFYVHGKWVFVHAGIDPTIPEIEMQNVNACIWSRSWVDVWNYAGGWKVVNGHTPTNGEPFVLFDHFNIDTACVFGYNLTAMVIDPETDEYEFVSVRNLENRNVNEL